jgi:Tfp pilus assembly protein PilO
MNRLSKEKRNQLLLVVLATLCVLAGLYFGLIRAQQLRLEGLQAKKQEAMRKLERIQETKGSAAKIETELARVRSSLDLQEQDMATDDHYAWMLDFIRKFKLPYPIDIRQFNSKGAARVSLFPKFPYQEMTVTIMGSGYYHDLGKFIADFENRYPSCRVMNLEMSPEATQSPDDAEKLSFKMDVVALIKPGPATSPKHP